MRILYIINTFSYGGAEKLVFDLSRRLIKECEYIGIVALYSSEKNIEGEIVSTLDSCGIETFIASKRAKKDRIKTILLIKKIINEKKIQIIHGHCPVPSFFADITSSITGVPVVNTIHNVNGYSRVCERVFAKKISAYISISSSVEKYMIDDLKIDRGKIHKIYNSIEIDDFCHFEKNRESAFWVKYGGIEKQFVIVNVARISMQKNQVCLIKGIKKCVDSGFTNIKLYIIGDNTTEKDWIEKINRLINDLGLEEYVCLLGQKSNIAEFLRNADLFVLTSLYEGFGISLVEAIISGLPVISTDMPVTHEFNRISKCISVIPQNDHISLANCIIQKKYFAQSNETVEIFSKKFSMGNYAAEHKKLYISVLNN